jgi:hypothetical protein
MKLYENLILYHRLFDLQRTKQMVLSIDYKKDINENLLEVVGLTNDLTKSITPKKQENYLSVPEFSKT